MTDRARRTTLKMLGLSAGAVGLASAAPLLCCAANADNTNDGTTSSSHRTLSDRIADFIVDAKLDDVPPAVVEKAKEQLVYFFGRAFQTAFTPAGSMLHEMARNNQLASGGATVIGTNRRIAAPQAAFVNASLFYQGGLDDVIWPSGVHAGVITLPAALALGELSRAHGRELLMAIVLGYEIPGKLGRAKDPWQAPLPRRASTVFGGYCPVVAGGRVIGLDRERMGHALGYAATICLGTGEGSVADHFYSLISNTGTLAVQLAQSGAQTDSEVTIEGELGLFRSFYGSVPAQLPTLVDRMGTDWEILTAVQKRYPGTGQNTSATELFLQLIHEAQLGADDVVSIDAFLPYNPVTERQQSLSWHGPFGDRFKAPGSLPFALAIALLDGRIDVARFAEERANDSTVASTMKNVNVSFERGHQGTWSKVRVRTRDNRTLEREVDSFMFPFPRSTWRDWLAESGAKLVPPAQLAQLEHLIADLEHVDDVSKVLAAATPRGTGARG